MKCITNEYNHWRINGNLRSLLIECRAGEDSRYDITNICVRDDKLVATDGRRLVEIGISHSIKSGMYFCTNDGFMLESEGKFPRYKDVIPEKKVLRKIVELSDSGQNAIGVIFGQIIASGCNISLSFYLKPIEILEQIIAGKVEVFVHKKDPAKQPFLIEAETTIGYMRYVQMPVNVKNEIQESK